MSVTMAVSDEASAADPVRFDDESACDD